jgi:type I restriction enzyme S subunit
MKYKSLHEVCDFISGLWTGKKPPYIKVNVIRNTNFHKSGNLDFENVAQLDVEIKQFNIRQLKFGDIILEKSGGGPNQPVGRVCLFEKKDEKFSLSNFTSALRVKNKNELNYKYLYYFLRYLYVSGETEKIQTNSTGIRNLQLKLYKEYKLFIPPLPIQQKIVAKLDKIFTEINNLESILQNKLSQVKMINNIIISSLVEKEKNLKKINLNNICNIKGRIGYRGYTKKDITAKGLGAISLSPSNIINSKLDFKKTTYVSWKKYEESPEIMINQGDIIFCKTGSTYGKTAYIESLPEKATLNPQLVVLKNIKCNKKYLFYYMMTENFKFQIEEIVGGTAMPTLSQEKLGQTIIKLPSEISQKIIVNKIDKCNKNIEQIFINTKIIINNIHSLKSKALQTQLSL